MQFENTLLDIERFLEVLAKLGRSGKWTARFEKEKIYMVNLERPKIIHTPLTAFVFAVTSAEVYDPDFSVMAVNVHGEVIAPPYLVLQFMDAERGTQGHSWNSTPIRKKIIDAIHPCLVAA